MALPRGFAMAIRRVRDVSIVFNELLSLMMLMPLLSFGDKKILTGFQPCHRIFGASL